MDITWLGHSALLVEAGRSRILIDPGAYSDDWHGLTGLTHVLVTHVHPDHVDVVNVPALLDANPDASVRADAAASPFSMRVSRRTARWRSQTGIFASVTRFSSASVMYLDVYGPADVPRLMGS